MYATVVYLRLQYSIIIKDYNEQDSDICMSVILGSMQG